MELGGGGEVFFFFFFFFSLGLGGVGGGGGWGGVGFDVHGVFETYFPESLDVHFHRCGAEDRCAARWQAGNGAREGWGGALFELGDYPADLFFEAQFHQSVAFVEHQPSHSAHVEHFGVGEVVCQSAGRCNENVQSFPQPCFLGFLLFAPNHRACDDPVRASQQTVQNHGDLLAELARGRENDGEEAGVAVDLVVAPSRAGFGGSVCGFLR